MIGVLYLKTCSHMNTETFTCVDKSPHWVMFFTRPFPQNLVPCNMSNSTLKQESICALLIEISWNVCWHLDVFITLVTSSSAIDVIAKIKIVSWKLIMLNLLILYHRLVFMGKGTKVVYIGSPTLPSQALDDDWAYTPFFEIPRYFDSADVKFLKYQVDSSNVDEFSLSAPPGLINRLYEASVKVNLTRMEALVRQALWENIAEREWYMSTDT